ncbi:MAG: PepSY-associated TM helix domain-containing protein [Desulfuromonadales bacterium]|nr:PepSY-associated TM helix domain-containing protein [Desulfuromonadales bacterium]
MKWRRWNYLLHRDIGFLCIGLTLLYAISGVAVNHISQWNPSYRVERIETNIGPVLGDPADAGTVRMILARLNEQGKLESSYRPDRKSLQLFVEGRSIMVDLASGHVVHDRAIPRPGLREMNFLHLNHPKKAWTWFADLYAVALAFLAISGLFMIRRKTLRRGLVLTGVGIVLPLFFLIVYL